METLNIIHLYSCHCHEVSLLWVLAACQVSSVTVQLKIFCPSKKSKLKIVEKSWMIKHFLWCFKMVCFRANEDKIKHLLDASIRLLLLFIKFKRTDLGKFIIKCCKLFRFAHFPKKCERCRGLSHQLLPQRKSPDLFKTLAVKVEVPHPAKLVELLKRPWSLSCHACISQTQYLQEFVFCSLSLHSQCCDLYKASTF